MLRTSNDRTTSAEIKASFFISVDKSPTIIQVIPAEEPSEIKVHIEKCPELIYPKEYKVVERGLDKIFYFNSKEIKHMQKEAINAGEGRHFWVEYYPIKKQEDRHKIEVPEDVQENLRNLGYLD